FAQGKPPRGRCRYRAPWRLLPLPPSSLRSSLSLESSAREASARLRGTPAVSHQLSPVLRVADSHRSTLLPSARFVPPYPSLSEARHPVRRRGGAAVRDRRS